MKPTKALWYEGLRDYSRQNHKRAVSVEKQLTGSVSFLPTLLQKRAPNPDPRPVLAFGRTIAGSFVGSSLEVLECMEIKCGVVKSWL